LSFVLSPGPHSLSFFPVKRWQRALPFSPFRSWFFGQFSTTIFRVGFLKPVCRRQCNASLFFVLPCLPFHAAGFLFVDLGVSLPFRPTSCVDCLTEPMPRLTYSDFPLPDRFIRFVPLFCYSVIARFWSQIFCRLSRSSFLSVLAFPIILVLGPSGLVVSYHWWASCVFF